MFNVYQMLGSSLLREEKEKSKMINITWARVNKIDSVLANFNNSRPSLISNN